MDDDGSLDDYFREVDSVPLLHWEEERDLLDRIKQGDEDARDALVRANLRLVYYIARTYQGNGLSLHDLIEAGNLGLLLAIYQHDGAEVRFSNFANFWIRRGIRRAIDRR